MMSKLQNFEIPQNDPFINDRLNRRPIAETMTDIVSFYGPCGCVLALNGEWGSGKTTFVNMWKQMLIEKGFKTLYFNAWTSDFSNDPLIAMISELKELNPKNDKINNIASKVGRIALSAGIDFIKAKTGIDCSNFNQTIEEASEIGKEYLKEFANKKETIEEFKREIIDFVASSTTEHPVVFIVDELDRCNPHYAVAVLERIKHLFDIPNIIFILAINKKELGHAIQGYYGSGNINSDEYLRRFIDIDFTLPKPNLKEFCEYLFEEYGFADFFRTNERRKYPDFMYDEKKFKEMALSIGNAEGTNLRQMERIFAYARLTLMQFDKNSYIIPDIYFLLCFWKVINPDFYTSIRSKEYNIQDLLSKLEDILPQNLLTIDYNYNNKQFYYTIASLIYCYDTTQPEGETCKASLSATKNTTTGKNDYGLTCKILNRETLNQILDTFYQRYYQEYSYGLNFILRKIDLLETFQQ